MKRIGFEFAGFREPIIAELLADQEPEYAAKCWADLEQPLKMWPWHTLSTGDWFSAKARTSLHPQAAGSQAMPIGKSQLLCEIERGSIVYNGGRAFNFVYGSDVTEPLPARGPVVARVLDPELFYEAGMHVWNAQYRTHKLVVVTGYRQEA